MLTYVNSARKTETSLFCSRRIYMLLTLTILIIYYNFISISFHLWRRQNEKSDQIKSVALLFFISSLVLYHLSYKEVIRGVILICIRKWCKVYILHLFHFFSSFLVDRTTRRGGPGGWSFNSGWLVHPPRHGRTQGHSQRWELPSVTNGFTRYLINLAWPIEL